MTVSISNTNTQVYVCQYGDDSLLDSRSREPLYWGLRGRLVLTTIKFAHKTFANQHNICASLPLLNFDWLHSPILRCAIANSLLKTHGILFTTLN